MVLGASFFVYGIMNGVQALLPVYVTALGGNTFHAGLLNALIAVTGLSLRPFFGPLGDSRGRKLPLWIGSFVFATAPLAFMASHSIAALAAARIYQGIGVAAYLSSATTLITDLVPPGSRGTALGVNRMVIITSLMTGPTAGLLLTRGGDFRPFFAVLAAGGLVAFLVVGLFRPPPWRASREPPSFGLGSFVDARANVPLRRTLVTMVVTSLAYGTAIAFTPLYLLNRDMQGAAFFFPLFALSGMAAAVLAGPFSDRYGRLAVLRPGLLVFAGGLAILATAPSFAALWLSAACIGAGANTGLIMLQARVVDAAHPGRRANAFALQESSMDVGIGGGTFLVGAVAVHTGFAPLFGAIALLFVATVAWTGFWREVPAGPGSSEDVLP